MDPAAEFETKVAELGAVERWLRLATHAQRENR